MSKNCLVIGASGGIGRAICERLTAEGYKLLVHYNQNKIVIDRLCDVLPDESILGIIQGDLSTNNGITTFLEGLHFPIDSVIFASGKSHYGLFQDVSEVEMDKMINLHVKSPWVISQHLLPYMIQNKFGHIILISSIWGEIGASCEVIYSSVKGAQDSFVKALAKEVAPSGISVNGVSPGFIDTSMNDTFSEDDKRMIMDEIPVKRAGKPEEVAHAVAFLLDEKSSYIQGEMLKVTGAW
ncbi:elongation factor P 5-aminopentanone reductase [Aquibacillus kalidii]|uniref:elongation factor P 5-aminopentanone reductase n=1 Tax=Aquibacillus kalidii TaxID=2762597 RepID=UPI001644F6E8|nr:SDR family oxidoreductase [Aquibacillus kalidii]